METAAASTPLAPSVEKAYYRKCIALKRRLNDVEAANDEAKIRRMRLDRAIMKMRLERAFLLDELRRRTDVDIEGSEGSGDDGMATPPQDRPHRDKRKKQAAVGADGSMGAEENAAKATVSDGSRAVNGQGSTAHSSHDQAQSNGNGDKGGEGGTSDDGQRYGDRRSQS